MKIQNNIKSFYSYKSAAPKDPNTEVGFYVDTKLNVYDDPIEKITVVDKYKRLHTVDYSGKTLMIVIKNGPLSTLVREAKRSDVELPRSVETVDSYGQKITSGFKEAYESYLGDLSQEEAQEQREKLYLYLSELPPENAIKTKNKTK